MGTLVEVSIGGNPLFGVVRWIGHLPPPDHVVKMAGIEMVSFIDLKLIPTLKIQVSIMLIRLCCKISQCSKYCGATVGLEPTDRTIAWVNIGYHLLIIIHSTWSNEGDSNS